MTSLGFQSAVLGTLVVLAALPPAPVAAACFESGVGCTNSGTIPYSALRRLSCDMLWTVRNAIYAENGYCFQTPRGRAAFDNSSCAYYDVGMVPLNAYERENVGRVVRTERERGCR